MAVSTVNKKEIGRCYKLIQKALDTIVDPITTTDFMFRFCSNLNLNNKARACFYFTLTLFMNFSYESFGWMKLSSCSHTCSSPLCKC